MLITIHLYSYIGNAASLLENLGLHDCTQTLSLFLLFILDVTYLAIYAIFSYTLVAQKSFAASLYNSGLLTQGKAK